MHLRVDVARDGRPHCSSRFDRLPITVGERSDADVVLCPLGGFRLEVTWTHVGMVLHAEGTEDSATHQLGHHAVIELASFRIELTLTVDDREWQTSYRDLSLLVPPPAEPTFVRLTPRGGTEDPGPTSTANPPDTAAEPTAEGRRAFDNGPAWLECLDGPPGTPHLTAVPYDRTIEIGRSASAGLAIDDPTVSRLHAALVSHPDGRYSIADVGSSNGIRVRGTKVAEATLEDRDLVEVGQVVFRFRRTDP